MEIVWIRSTYHWILNEAQNQTYHYNQHLVKFQCNGFNFYVYIISHTYTHSVAWIFDWIAIQQHQHPTINTTTAYALCARVCETWHSESHRAKPLLLISSISPCLSALCLVSVMAKWWWRCGYVWPLLLLFVIILVLCIRKLYYIFLSLWKHFLYLNSCIWLTQPLWCLCLHLRPLLSISLCPPYFRIKCVHNFWTKHWF